MTTKKLALVTGANRGIGLQFCRQLKLQGWRVLALCREKSKELSGLEVEVQDGIDVTDQKSVAKILRTLGKDKIDLLVNNAGVLHEESGQELNPEHLRHQFEVNAMGPLLLTLGLVPHLAPGSKVAMITSKMGSISDNSSGGYYGYRMSKAALNMAGMSLARDLLVKK